MRSKVSKKNGYVKASRQKTTIIFFRQGGDRDLRKRLRAGTGKSASPQALNNLSEKRGTYFSLV
jgi:hypothetical protein